MQGSRSRQSLIWTHNDTRGGGDLSVYTATPLSKFQRSRVCGAALLLCNYPESLGANLCGWHKCLPLVFPSLSAYVHTLCPSVAPCVCNMGGLEVVASASPYTWGEMALMAVLSVGIVLPLSLHLTLFAVMYSCLLKLWHSLWSFRLCSFCKKPQGHSMATSILCVSTVLRCHVLIHWSAH